LRLRGLRRVGLPRVGLPRVGLRRLGLRGVGLRGVGLRGVGLRRLGLRGVGLRGVGLRRLGLRGLGLRRLGLRRLGLRRVGLPAEVCDRPLCPSSLPVFAAFIQNFLQIHKKSRLTHYIVILPKYQSFVNKSPKSLPSLRFNHFHPPTNTPIERLGPLPSLRYACFHLQGTPYSRYR
jgi:hypothetical protein